MPFWMVMNYRCFSNFALSFLMLSIFRSRGYIFVVDTEKVISEAEGVGLYVSLASGD